MKKLLLAALCFFTGLTAVPANSPHSPAITDGTYVVRSVHNIIYYFANGYVLDLQSEGNLSNFLAADPMAKELVAVLSTIAFRFDGNRVYMISDGVETPYPLDYTLTDGRLRIYEKGEMILTSGFKNDGTTFFIWDFATFQAMGMDVRFFTNMGVTDFEFWIAMRRK